MVDSRRTPTGSVTSYPANTITVSPVSYTPRLDTYGGSMNLPRSTATGKFYISEIAGKQWLIDPLGYRFISMGVNSVSVQDTATSTTNALIKYGDLSDGWATAVNTELKDMGFNSVGAWSNVELLAKAGNNKTVYVTLGYFMRDYARTPAHLNNYSGRVSSGSGNDSYTNNVIYVFEPEFTDFAMTRAASIVSNFGSDPYFLGIISDNELPLAALTLLDANLAMTDENDPMYTAVRSWLAARSKSPTNYNDNDRRQWVGYVYGEYTRIIKQAIQATGVDVLYLGSRLHQKSTIESPDTFTTARQYLDVVTLNYYNYWEPDHGLLTNALGNLPFIVTEFYTKALDAIDVYGNLFANTSGAGWCVPTDADRASFYQNFVTKLLQHPNGVGWHWFRYTDNDPQATGVDPSNIDSNKGLYRLDYTAYENLSAAMRTVHKVAYHIKEQG